MGLWDQLEYSEYSKCTRLVTFSKMFNLTSFRNLPLIRQPCLYSRNAEQLSDFRCRSVRVTKECSLSETGQYGSY